MGEGVGDCVPEQWVFECLRPPGGVAHHRAGFQCKTTFPGFRSAQLPQSCGSKEATLEKAVSSANADACELDGSRVGTDDG